MEMREIIDLCWWIIGTALRSPCKNLLMGTANEQEMRFSRMMRFPGEADGSDTEKTHVQRSDSGTSFECPCGIQNEGERFRRSDGNPAGGDLFVRSGVCEVSGRSR